MLPETRSSVGVRKMCMLHPCFCNRIVFRLEQVSRFPFDQICLMLALFVPIEKTAPVGQKGLIVALFGWAGKKFPSFRLAEYVQSLLCLFRLEQGPKFAFNQICLMFALFIPTAKKSRLAKKV